MTFLGESERHFTLRSKPLTLLAMAGLLIVSRKSGCGCRNRNRQAMKKNICRPVLMGPAIAALLISALAATSYPALAALSAPAPAAAGSDTPVPAAPSNVTAQAVGTTSIQVSWTNNASNQSGVVVSLDGQQSADL